MEIQVPSNIYIGRNVVRLHLTEFLELASSRNLLGADEQVLAVFDCIIMEAGGVRLGGLTLHDYAIVTTKHLITWARGRSKDVIDKCIWSYLAIDATKQRNPIEGMLKLVYKAPPATSRRRISLRSRDPEGEKAEENLSTVEGVEIYLDYMPVEEVSICQKMINFFILKERPAGPVVEVFNTAFRAELEESTLRITTLPAVLRPLYIRQPNGVYVEVADMDEARLLRSEDVTYSAPASGKKGYASPYQLNRQEINTASDSGKFVPYKSNNKTERPGSAKNQSKLDSMDWNSPLPKSGYEPRPTPPKPVPGRGPAREERPVAPPKTQPTLVPRPLQAENPNEGAEANYPAPTTDTSSIYSVSRIAHGLLEGRQNFTRSMSDIGETAAIVASLPGLFSEDTKARQTALLKLRSIFESGYLENNKLLNNALIPLMQPIINRFSPAETPESDKSKRINLSLNKESKIQRLSPVVQNSDAFAIPIREEELSEEDFPIPEWGTPSSTPSASEPRGIRLGKFSSSDEESAPSANVPEPRRLKLDKLSGSEEESLTPANVAEPRRLKLGRSNVVEPATPTPTSAPEPEILSATSASEPKRIKLSKPTVAVPETPTPATTPPVESSPVESSAEPKRISLNRPPVSEPESSPTASVTEPDNTPPENGSEPKRIKLGKRSN